MVSNFAFFSLEGDRFEGPGLPVDAAREVGVFRSVILSIARNVWLEEHPERQKVPNGFSDAFDLRLLSIETGSARPSMVLERPEAITDESWTELEKAFCKGRDLLTETLAEIAAGQPPPTHFPANSLNELRKLGASLTESETLTVGPPEPASRRARINQKLRESLWDLANTVGEPSAPIELTGIIVQFNGEQSTFGLRTDRSVSTCSFVNNQNIAKKAKDYLATDGLNAPGVRVTGLTRNSTSTTIHLFSVESIEIIHSVGETAILRRIRGFAAMHDEELGPGTKPPTKEVRRRAEALAPEIHGLGTPVMIVPTGEGGISMEWLRGDHSLTIDLDPDGRMLLCSDNTLTDELGEYSGAFSLDQVRHFISTGELPK